MTMYLDHFGLREPPFRITPHTEFFFDGANRGATLDALIYAITHDEGIVKVTGEVGSGKTMLCRMLLEKLPARVETVYLANPSLSRDELLHALSDELQIPTPPERPHLLLRTLQQHLVDLYASGKQVVVLIDEAHAMPPESLEEVRLLSNLESSRSKLLQIVLFGQPELNAVLARTEMRQLRERVTHNFALEPLQRNDVGSYLMFRMRAAGYRGPDLFTDAAVRLVAGSSAGLTRRVNILADKALLAAYAENLHQVTPKQARAAIRDAQFQPLDNPEAATATGRRGLAIAATLGGLAAALATGWWLSANRPAGALAAAPDAAASTTVVPDLPVKPPASPPAGDRQAAFNAWLANTPDDRYFIQLLRTRADGSENLDAFLTRASRGLDASQLRVYRLAAQGQDWLGVIYGDYPDRQSATAALRTLPAELREGGAYPRAVGKLRPR